MISFLTAVCVRFCMGIETGGYIRPGYETAGLLLIC